MHADNEERTRRTDNPNSGAIRVEIPGKIHHVGFANPSRVRNRGGGGTRTVGFGGRQSKVVVIRRVGSVDLGTEVLVGVDVAVNNKTAVLIFGTGTEVNITRQILTAAAPIGFATRCD